MKSTLIGMALLAMGWMTLVSQAATPSAPTPTSQPTSASAKEEATADEVIRSLLMERPKMAVLPADAPATEPTSQPTLAAPATLLNPIESAPGTVMVNRLGRLVKDANSDWWTFHFESEGNSRVQREMPLRILPNRQLEAMEETSQGGTRPGLRFRISGEVMEYRQGKYLLLRNWMVERDMGQL